jgi:hypothetical protein
MPDLRFTSGWWVPRGHERPNTFEDEDENEEEENVPHKIGFIPGGLRLVYRA